MKKGRQHEPRNTTFRNFLFDYVSDSGRFWVFAINFRTTFVRPDLDRDEFRKLIHGVKLKIQEIRKKADSDLLKLLAELKEDVRTLRFKVASKEIKNHQLLRQAKKTISRVLTVLKEREHAP